MTMIIVMHAYVVVLSWYIWSHTHTHTHNYYASVEEGLHQISAKEVQSAVDKSYQASLLSLQQWAAAAT